MRLGDTVSHTTIAMSERKARILVRHARRRHRGGGLGRSASWARDRALVEREIVDALRERGRAA